MADAASTNGSCEGKSLALLARPTALLQTSVQADGRLKLEAFDASPRDQQLIWSAMQTPASVTLINEGKCWGKCAKWRSTLTRPASCGCIIVL